MCVGPWGFDSCAHFLSHPMYIIIQILLWNINIPFPRTLPIQPLRETVNDSYLFASTIPFKTLCYLLFCTIVLKIWKFYDFFGSELNLSVWHFSITPKHRQILGNNIKLKISILKIYNYMTRFNIVILNCASLYLIIKASS